MDSCFGLSPGSVSVSEVSVDDLELSQRVCESLLLADTRLRPEGEEAVLGACGRLRHTVDTLLELLNQANTQVTHRRPTLTARPRKCIF